MWNGVMWSCETKSRWVGWDRVAGVRGLHGLVLGHSLRGKGTS